VAWFRKFREPTIVTFILLGIFVVFFFGAMLQFILYIKTSWDVIKLQIVKKYQTNSTNITKGFVSWGSKVLDFLFSMLSNPIILAILLAISIVITAYELGKTKSGGFWT